MDNVKPFPNSDRRFPVEGELAQRLLDLVHEYNGRISLVAALGCLEFVKLQLIQDQKNA